VIGILGGTFDPIHLGHLRMAEELREAIGLTQVHFIPAAVPPHRPAPQGDTCHRTEMVRLAISDNPAFTLDTRELHRSGASYTFDTLYELRTELGHDTPLCLMIGSDAFLNLPTWHRWQELLDLTHIVVAHRPGATPHAEAMTPTLRHVWQTHQADDPATLQATAAGRILLQTITALDISASRIRNRLHHGRSPRYLLPDSVCDYIHTHHLYTKEPHAT
jgi:nicotinate-nucleotide adenylyltransferase